MPLFGLLHWEDNFISVTDLNNIVKPRKDVENYEEGEYVQLKYRQGQQLFHAVVSEISEDKDYLLIQKKMENVKVIFNRGKVATADSQTTTAASNVSNITPSPKLVRLTQRLHGSSRTSHSSPSPRRTSLRSSPKQLTPSSSKRQPRQATPKPASKRQARQTTPEPTPSSSSKRQATPEPTPSSSSKRQTTPEPSPKSSTKRPARQTISGPSPMHKSPGGSKTSSSSRKPRQTTPGPSQRKIAKKRLYDLPGLELEEQAAGDNYRKAKSDRERLDTLEEDVDYLKGQVKTLKKMLKKSSEKEPSSASHDSQELEAIVKESPSPAIATGSLIRKVFSSDELKNYSITGKKTAKCSALGPRPAMDQEKLRKIENMIRSKWPNFRRKELVEKIQNIQKVLRLSSNKPTPRV